jgi:phosphonate transport system substrate-binding protein
MSRRRSIWLLPAAVIAATTMGSAQTLAQDNPDKLTIGFVPSVEAGALVETIQPLADYLTEKLGIPTEGFVSTDYSAMVEAMKADQVQIAFLPPLGLVQAVDTAGAEMILQTERYGSVSYHTQFMATDASKYCMDDPVENERQVGDAMVNYLNCNGTARAYDATPEGPVGLDALANVEPGTTVSFVDPTSASGYIFPATIFLNLGLNPESDLKSIFAGSHDASVIAVCTGQAEVGVSFDDARPVAATDCDVPGTVVTFAYGPEIPNDGEVVAGSLPTQLKADIKQALLDYAQTEDGKTVLYDIYEINAFGEPNLDSLQIIRDAVEKLGYGSGS